MKIIKYILIFFSTGLLFGYFPFFSGTVGSILGAALFYLLPVKTHLLSTLILTLFAVFVSHFSEKYFPEKDPKQIVIDEIAGMMITFILIPKTPLFIFLGFLLFRFFDIVKVYPINKLQKIRGGLGIVADDIMAGIYSLVILQALRIFIKN